MELSTMIASASALVSLCGATVSFLYYRKSLVARARSNTVQFSHWRQQYLRDLRDWAAQVCDAMAVAMHLCELDPEKTTGPDFFTRRHELRTRLSALIDRGRWFLPNEHTEHVGLHKPLAFRGVRQPIVSAVAKCYDLVGDLNYVNRSNNPVIRERIVQVKRTFVSHSQETLDPARDWEEYRRFVQWIDDLQTN